MLKILQAIRLQQYVNCELPDVQVGFRKGRGTRDQIANIRCIIKKARDGMGREEGLGWGTRVYLWQIHVDIWQNQYNIVKLKNKIKKIKKKIKQDLSLTQGGILV